MHHNPFIKFFFSYASDDAGKMNNTKMITNTCMHVLVTFFLMWNRVKYGIKIFMADKHATSNFPPEKHPPDST